MKDGDAPTNPATHVPCRYCKRMQLVTLTNCTVCGAPILAGGELEVPASEEEKPPSKEVQGPVTAGPWRFISCKGACASLKTSHQRMVLDFNGVTPVIRCAVCGSTDDPHPYTNAGLFVGVFVGVGALIFVLSRQIYDTFSWWKSLVVLVLGVFGLFLCAEISDVRARRRTLKFGIDHRVRTTPFVPPGMDLSHAVARTAGRCGTCGTLLETDARSTGGTCPRCGAR